MWAQIRLIWEAWKIALLVTVIACLTLFGTVQSWRLERAQAQLSQSKQAAKDAQEQRDATIEKLRESIPVMVEQAAKNALTNFRARYGSGNAACGLRADSVLPAFGGGQDAGPARTGEAGGEHLAVDADFIEACARDAGRLNLWIEACRANPMICEIKEN